MAASKVSINLAGAQVKLDNPLTRIQFNDDAAKATIKHNTTLYIMSRTGSYIWHKVNFMLPDWGRVVFNDCSEAPSMLFFTNKSIVLLVDVDIFKCLEDAIDWLLEFRLHNPTIPVVITSDQFTYNDLSIQRMAIADASVRTPSSIDFLIGAVLQAIENNKLYQKAVSANQRNTKKA